MKKDLITADVRLSYRIEGSGKPVMLLHGYAEDSEIWEAQIEYLKSQFQLIIPDLPGTADSQFLKDITSDEKFSQLEYYAGLIRQIAMQENIEKFTLLGHSMGGYITLAFAEKCPGLLNGFGLIHSTAFADSDEKKSTRSAAIEFLDSNSSRALLKNSLPALFGKKFKQQHREIIQHFIEKYSAIDPEVLQAYSRAMRGRPDRTAVLKNANFPVLFIIGEEDAAAPLEDLLKQVKLPEITYIHILEETGHMGMIENSQKINEYLLEYLQETL